MKKADWKRLEKVLTNIEIESPIVVNSNEGERTMYFNSCRSVIVVV